MVFPVRLYDIKIPSTIYMQPRFPIYISILTAGHLKTNTVFITKLIINCDTFFYSKVAQLF